LSELGSIFLFITVSLAVLHLSSHRCLKLLVK